MESKQNMEYPIEFHNETAKFVVIKGHLFR